MLATSAWRAPLAGVGNFGFALGEEDPKTTRLVHVDLSGNAQQVAGGVWFDNALTLGRTAASTVWPRAARSPTR